MLSSLEQLSQHLQTSFTICKSHSDIPVSQRKVWHIYRRRSQIRTQLLQIWTLALMLYLWSKKQLSKKYDLTLRLCGSLHRALTAKSHKITFQIQEINCQKILCMQQNDIKFLTNFQVEKKVPNFCIDLDTTAAISFHQQKSNKQQVSQHC